MIETSLRPIAVIVELAILTALTYCLFVGVEFTLFDLGFGKKYKTFVTWVMMIMGCLALIFFLAHLITFYPRISPMSRF